MADLVAIHTSNRCPRTIVLARPLVILSTIELQQTCPHHRRTLLLLLSYESYHLQSEKLMDPLIFKPFLALLDSNHLYSSKGVKLLSPH